MSPISHNRSPALLKRLFSRPAGDGPAERPSVDGAPARLPANLRVYVIGDIHGRLDLLGAIETLIAEDAAASGAERDKLIVYLGDFVDRGFESKGVIDHLINRPIPGFRRIMLLGNHDLWLREFVRGQDGGEGWMRFGGDATLLSYGVKMDFELPDKARMDDARAQIAASIPPDHMDFLDGLELGFGLGDYFFCHAGIRPGVALEDQTERDLAWIREPFLSSTAEHGKVIVHGHTIENVPVVRRNRIGIDTGACFTGDLTCLVLDGKDYRFLSTLDPDLAVPG